MNTNSLNLIAAVALLVLPVLPGLHAQDAPPENDPPPAPAPVEAPEPAVPPEPVEPPEVQPADVQPADAPDDAPADAPPSTPVPVPGRSDRPRPSRSESPSGTGRSRTDRSASEGRSPAAAPARDAGELRLNFRNAPLDLVLDYLSEAAGFTIVLETKVRGSIDVWSNHPVSTDEAIEILDSALGQNGYAALRNGKTLTIVSKEAAKTRNIPIVQSTDWETIPQTDVVATYIIPVRYINAAELINTLSPLTPEKMQITANNGSNSLLITDTQAAIRRIAHIASLLDSSVSSVSSMKIIPLKHSDAKAMAQTINDLYRTTGNANNRNANQGNTGRGGFQFPGGFGGRGGN